MTTTRCDFDCPNEATWAAPQVAADGSLSLALACDAHYEGWWDDVDEEAFARMVPLVRHLDGNCAHCRLEALEAKSCGITP